MHIAICDDDSRLAAEPNGVVITSGGEAQKLMMARALYKTPPSCCGTNPPAALDPVSEYEVRPPLPSHLRRTHLCLNQSPAGLLPLLRRDSGVRCIVQRGSHRQLLAEEAVCPAVARSGAA